MHMEHTPENLEFYSAQQQNQEEKKEYTPRPLSHHIVAWLLIAVVLFGFLGMCYWMINFGRV